MKAPSLGSMGRMRGKKWPCHDAAAGAWGRGAGEIAIATPQAGTATICAASGTAVAVGQDRSWAGGIAVAAVRTATARAGAGIAVAVDGTVITGPQDKTRDTGQRGKRKINRRERTSALYKTSGFRQSFGRTPVTTSIAACMARVRSSMPDSSDQYATCGLSTV